MKNLFIILLLVALFQSIIISQPCSGLYYTRYHEYQRYVLSCALDGTGESYFTTDIRPEGIAVDWSVSPKKLYIGLVPSSGDSKIIRCNLDGTSQEDVLTGLTGTGDIELDLINRKIFYIHDTYTDDYIYKADMDGLNSNITQVYHFTTDNNVLWGIALDASSGTLWMTRRGSTCNSSSVVRMTTSGSSYLRLENSICNPHDIEYYDGWLYLGTGDGLERMDPGSDARTVLVSGAKVGGLAIDGSNDDIFWVDYIASKVKRCNLDGSGETDISGVYSSMSMIDTDYNPEAMPVEITSFTAARNDDRVMLNWATATEVNNYGFQVERASSPPGSHEVWEKIGFVQGHGNSNSPKEYEFIDNLNLNSDLYHYLKYRLKQIDTDGSFTYYDHIAEVDMSATEVEDENIPVEIDLSHNFPNPFNPTTQFSYSVDSPQNVKISIYNNLGEFITTLVQGHRHAGVHSVEFDALSINGRIASGVYFYKLSTESKTITKKMVLAK